MAIPLHLGPLYPDPQKVSLLSFEYLAPLLVVCGLTLTGLLLIRRTRIFIAAWVFYLVTLTPVLGIVKVGAVSVADRFTYLPGLGLFFLAGLFASRPWAVGGGLRLGGTVSKSIVAGIGLAAAISMSYLTVRQISFWHDSITLWSYVIEQYPARVPIAYFNRGLVLGRTGQFDRAIEDFSAAIALSPAHAEAYMNRGAALGAAGRYDEAIQDLDRTIMLKPESVQAYINRGLAYESTSQYERAIEDYTRALTLSPEFVRAYVDRGSLYLKTGRPERAEQDFQKACDAGSDEGCRLLNEYR
jgi:hypothetical protein